jgi:hypothetical protein
MADEITGIAEHSFLDAGGEKVGTSDDDLPKATGYRYRDRLSGEVFEVQLNVEPGTPEAILALFGLKTKYGHLCSSGRKLAARLPRDGAPSTRTVENGKAEMVKANAWYNDVLLAGQWNVARVGGVGRLNLDTLAEAIHLVAGKASKGVEAYRAQLDDKEFYTRVVNNDKAKAHYRAIKAKADGKASAAIDVSDII